MDASEATRLSPHPQAPTLRVVRESEALTTEDIADGVAALGATYARDTSPAGVCVADGMGLRLHVDRGALVVSDGMGEHRRERRFDKATHGLSRLVILGSSGSLSIDALRWCSRLGIGVLVLSPDGTCQLASTPKLTDDARLRRTQALAPTLPVGLDLARYVLRWKVKGQAAIVAGRFDDKESAETIGVLAEAMEDASTIDELRQLEASAAALYFGAWSGRQECAPRFATQDRRRVPSHWTRYDGRRSVLASSKSNRKAERPVNALLNYVYALVEAEAMLACQVVGLDPGVGVIHLDTKGRHSLALDLMEPVRPDVDAFVLDLVERRTFCKVEFTETNDGHVRLRAPLTHELAETIPRWAKALAPIAEHVAHALGKAMEGSYQPATPLTKDRSKTAQAVVKARKAVSAVATASTRVRQRPTGEAQMRTWACPECGGIVTNQRHVRCDDCIAADPSQAPEVRSRRGEAIAARKRALAEWERSHPGIVYDPEMFQRDILPGLQGVKLSDIVAATGLSKGYASNVRAGKWTPHVSTWPALARLAQPHLDA
jgi:CRISPR-associated endonuclease Cas1